MRSTLTVAALAALLCAAPALAQTTAPSTTAPSTTAPKAKAAAPRSEKSKACSAEADQQNLHGKKRKAFRKACLKRTT